MLLHAAWRCWANISSSSCTCLAAAVVSFSVIKWIIVFCRFRRWVGWLWVLRLWWCSSWLCSCCTDMETLRSSSAWCCLARCWPGICASSSSLFYLWTSARSVPFQVIRNLPIRLERCSLNAYVCLHFVYTDHLQPVQDRPGTEACLHIHAVTNQSHNLKWDSYTY